MKRLAFVIMPIEKPETEFLWKEVFYPTLDGLGFAPKRIDRHTEGEQLKTGIKKFIEIADIVVAELTGQRPNCYLEIGYTMGREKYKNLIPCARVKHTDALKVEHQTVTNLSRTVFLR